MRSACCSAAGATRATVRAGADEALVEGRFCDVDGADEVTVARTLAREGRSRAWIDGRMVPLGALAEATSGLLELHGQHQHRALVVPEAQRDALDAFGGVDTGPMDAARRRLAALLREAEGLGGDARQRAREAEVLAFQVAEVEGAGLTGPERGGGRWRRRRTGWPRRRPTGRRRPSALVALTGSDGGPGGPGAEDLLGQASGALAGRAPLEPLDRRVRGLMAEVADLADRAARRGRHVGGRPGPPRGGPGAAPAPPRAPAQVRGHPRGGRWPSPTEGRARLEALAAAEARAAALDHDIARARADVAAAEAVVAAARRKVAPLLASEIESTLHDLAMPSARFTIEVAGDGSGDQVTFELAANPGEPARPLAKAASGGELSRTMLAVRLALTDAPGVLVFDEVDAGVGGEAATAVGAALAGLGHYAQVLVVTHLAQVAAQARPPGRGAQGRGRRPDPCRGGRARPGRPGGGDQPHALGQPGLRGRTARTPASSSAAGPGAARPRMTARPATGAGSAPGRRAFR